MTVIALKDGRLSEDAIIVELTGRPPSQTIGFWHADGTSYLSVVVHPAAKSHLLR